MTAIHVIGKRTCEKQPIAKDETRRGEQKQVPAPTAQHVKKVLELDELQAWRDKELVRTGDLQAVHGSEVYGLSGRCAMHMKWNVPWWGKQQQGLFSVEELLLGA